jgi:hypothetical protein
MTARPAQTTDLIITPFSVKGAAIYLKAEVKK